MDVTLKTSAKYVFFALLVLLIVLVGLRSGPPPRGLGTLAGLTFLGSPTASPTGFAFTITNAGDSAVVYMACPPQVQSNGVWGGVQFPLAPARIAKLPA